MHKHTYALESSVAAGPETRDRASPKRKKRQSSKTSDPQGNQFLVNETRSSSQSQSKSRRPSIVQQRFEANPAVPILKIGAEYILGQPKFKSNVTFEKGPKSNATSQKEPKSNPKVGTRSLEDLGQLERGASRFRPHKMVEQRAVEGPIQCGAGKPCADGSCCNSVRHANLLSGYTIVLTRTRMESVGSNHITVTQLLRSPACRTVNLPRCAVLTLPAAFLSVGSIYVALILDGVV